MTASPRWNAATLLTFCRLLLAPVVIWQILSIHPSIALALVVIAGLTDLFDGAIARATSSTTDFGQLLDPIADKFLLSGIFVGLAWIGSVPLWFVAIVFGRDVFLLIASAIVMARKISADLKPSIWGKLSTLLQIITAGVFIAVPVIVPRDLANFLLYPTAAATLLSGFQYAFRGIRQLRNPAIHIDAPASRE